MERLEPRIAEAILSAPGWARVGITAPTSSMRDAAARKLADSIVQAMASSPAGAADEGQSTLPL